MNLNSKVKINYFQNILTIRIVFKIFYNKDHFMIKN